MRLVFSQAADRDLEKIYFEGLMKFGLKDADDYHADLQKTLLFISGNPTAVRERLEFEPPVRVHPFRSHVIIFKIFNDYVLIIRVQHGREDWMADYSGSQE